MRSNHRNISNDKISVVLPRHIHAAKTQVSGMSMADKEAEFDIIYREQPNLLASVLVQQKLGNSMEQMDVLLHILLVIHLSLREANRAIATVSEDEQERRHRRLIARIKFTEDLDQTSSYKAMEDMLADWPEKWLFAYTFNEMNVAGFYELTDEHSKHLILCGLNLVNCVNADW